MTDERTVPADFSKAPGRSLTSHDARFRDDPHAIYDALRSAESTVWSKSRPRN